MQAAAAGQASTSSVRAPAVTRFLAPLAAGHPGDDSSGSGSGRWLFLPAVDEWDGLCVEYDPPWPLPLLLTPPVPRCFRLTSAPRLAPALGRACCADFQAAYMQLRNPLHRPHPDFVTPMPCMTPAFALSLELLPTAIDAA